MQILEEKMRVYMESAPVQKSILYMVLPMMLSFIAGILYNMTDAYFVGQLGETSAMAAVTLAIPVFALFMALGHLLGTGCGTYISRLLGEEKFEKVKRVGAINFYGSLAIGGVTTGLGILFLGPLVTLLGGRDAMIIPTTQYLFWYLLGAPFILANFSLEECVRAEGASTISMRGMILGILINMVLDPILMFSFDYGIAGAAIATVIGNVASVVYYSFYLQCKSKVQSIALKDLTWDWQVIREILRIGISAFLMDMFMAVSGILFNQYAAPYGDHVIASFGISQRIVQIIEFISMSFAMGTVPLFAYAYASGNIKRRGALLRWTLGMMLGTTLLLNIILLIGKTEIINVFSNNLDVKQLCAYILSIQISVTLLAAVTSLLTALFQAYGQSFESTLMSSTRGVIFLFMLIGGHIYFGIEAIIWAMPLAEIIGFFVAVMLYMKVRKKTYVLEGGN